MKQERSRWCLVGAHAMIRPLKYHHNRNLRMIGTYRQVLVRTMLLASALFLVSACGSRDVPELSVLNLKYQQLPGGARIVSGDVFNSSERPVPSAQLQLSLLDENNIRISSMIIVVRDIPAGEKVSFREPVDEVVDVHAARVRSVLVL